jgi:hypothetical protein
MGEFIAQLFLTRELAHRYHLSTKSYAQHKALGNFYEDLLDLTDDLSRDGTRRTWSYHYSYSHRETRLQRSSILYRRQT